MKKSTHTTLTGCLFVMLATGYAATASANAASDCRQEAQDYGIVAEGLDDYIEGCLASRGELIVDEAVSMEYAPPGEMDEELVSPTDEEPVPPPDDADVEQ